MVTARDMPPTKTSRLVGFLFILPIIQENYTNKTNIRGFVDLDYSVQIIAILVLTAARECAEADTLLNDLG
jgi:hypothetical protein